MSEQNNQSELDAVELSDDEIGEIAGGAGSGEVIASQ